MRLPRCGAVRLLARDEGRRALLVERCRPGTCLWDAPADEAVVVADLLPRLSVELDDPAPFRLLADESERWTEEVAKRYELGGRPFELRLLDFALDTFARVERGATFLATRTSTATTYSALSVSPGS